MFRGKNQFLVSSVYIYIYKDNQCRVAAVQQVEWPASAKILQLHILIIADNIVMNNVFQSSVSFVHWILKYQLSNKLKNSWQPLIIILIDFVFISDYVLINCFVTVNSFCHNHQLMDRYSNCLYFFLYKILLSLNFWQY